MAVAKNDITGDDIKSRIQSNSYDDGYDGIDWSVKLDDPVVTPAKPVDNAETFDEERQDIIGQNGNDGEHYNEQT